MPDLVLTLGEPHIAVLEDAHRFVVLDAGRGFGKTQLILARMFRHLKTIYTDAYGTVLPHKIWYIAPTYKQGKLVMWARLKAFFKPMTVAKNESEMTLILVNGAEIRIVGSEQYDNLRGPYLTLAIFDEFAFHHPNYWTRVIRPMLGRVVPLGGAEFYSTPDGHNEFYELFQAGQSSDLPEWSAWQFTSQEGGFIPLSEIMEAQRHMTFEDWRQEYYGEFIGGAGRVYYPFARADHCKRVNHVPGLDIHWAWDFNQVPSCHSNLSHVHKGRVYLFDEIFTGNTEAVAEAFIQRYPKAKLEDPETGRLAKIYLYGDASGGRATSGVTDYMMVQHILRESGYPDPEVRVSTANPLVRDRVNSVNVKLRNAAGEVGIVMNAANCPRLLKDFEQVKWDKTGRDLDKLTDPNLTHASDALGYMIYTLWPIESPATKVLRGRRRRMEEHNGYWVSAPDAA